VFYHETWVLYCYVSCWSVFFALMYRCRWFFHAKCNSSTHAKYIPRVSSLCLYVCMNKCMLWEMTEVYTNFQRSISHVHLCRNVDPFFLGLFLKCSPSFFLSSSHFESLSSTLNRIYFYTHVLILQLYCISKNRSFSVLKRMSRICQNLNMSIH
jgi:hypothetical protein